MGKGSVAVNAETGEPIQNIESQQPKQKFNFRSFILVAIARMGIKSQYLILAEVRDSKARFGKVQFLFHCRPWILGPHINSINKLAIDQAVAMGMFKAGECREVNILMIKRIGFV